MVPQAYLQEWSAKAPWPELRQVEQDLAICRALCDLFNAPALAGRIALEVALDTALKLKVEINTREIACSASGSTRSKSSTAGRALEEVAALIEGKNAKSAAIQCEVPGSADPGGDS